MLITAAGCETQKGATITQNNTMHTTCIKTNFNMVVHKISQMTIDGWGTGLVKMLTISEILYFSVAQRGLPHNF